MFTAFLTSSSWAEKTYIGDKFCRICHADQAEWFLSGVHADTTISSGLDKGQMGCETCHGPGSEHVEQPLSNNIITFQTESPLILSSRCLSCHATDHPVINFRRSDHHVKKVSCSSCHSIGGSKSFHQMRSVQDVMDRNQTDLCYGCHLQVRTDFALPFHHPISEGFMQCSSCHEQHGGFTLRQLRTRHNEAVCTKCHEHQHGPFIFEHPPGAADSCQTCHNPHGSTNTKMLNRPVLRFLCLECHSNTPSFHDLTQTLFQNCTVCHSRVHGSNLSRFLFD